MIGWVYWLSIALYVSGFVYFTYYCIMSDPEDSKMADFWTRRVPSMLSSRLSRLIGSKNVQRLEVLSEYTLQLVYLVVVLGAWSVIFAHVYPWVRESEHVPTYHLTIGVGVFLACMTSWRYACNSSPGVITARSLAKFDKNYSYDHLLFVPNRICPTVGIPKLARSKYDRFSKLHIARFDHFCGWLHNAVGQENYRFFLVFLLVHVLMCIYGVVIVSKLVWGEIQEKELLEVTFFNVHTGEEVQASWYIVVQYLLGRHFWIASVWFLMAVMSLCLGGFLGFHVWITSIGMTTNESYKWGQVKKWHKQELRRYKDAVKNGLIVPAQESLTRGGPVVSDGDIGCTGAIGESSATNSTEPQDEAISDPGPYPKNIYDFGMVENWKDVLFPRSLRPDALERYRKSLRDQKIPVARTPENNGKSKST